jgi:hypothetical protein
MKIHKSKKDWPLGLFIWIPILGAIIFSFYTMEYAAIIVTGIVGFIVAGIWFGTSYVIEEDKLIVRVGLISYTPINVVDIKLLKNTRTMLASPACSFDRVLIKYGKYDEIAISPKNKKEFLEDLKRINPYIQLS